jgi:hypothetical protein
MNQSMGVSGFPCPDCGERIVATMEQILSGAPIACRCGLLLRVDQVRSEETLADLRELAQRLEQLRP